VFLNTRDVGISLISVKALPYKSFQLFCKDLFMLIGV